MKTIDELRRLGEANLKNFTPQQVEMLGRQIDRESEAETVQAFESLGVPHDGAVAAARGPEAQPEPSMPVNLSEVSKLEETLELPGGRQVKLSEASAAEIQVAESFARQRDAETREIFESLCGGNKTAAAFAAKGRAA
jgi:hypothetical protein